MYLALDVISLNRSVTICAANGLHFFVHPVCCSSERASLQKKVLTRTISTKQAKSMKISKLNESIKFIFPAYEFAKLQKPFIVLPYYFPGSNLGRSQSDLVGTKQLFCLGIKFQFNTHSYFTIYQSSTVLILFR